MNKFRSSDDVVRMAQRRKVIQNMVPLAICKFPQRAPLASNISRKSHMIGWCNWARLIKRLTDRGVCRIRLSNISRFKRHCNCTDSKRNAFEDLFLFMGVDIVILC